MVRKRIKQEIKKPDIVIRTFTFSINWIKSNLKLCLACIAGALIIFLCIFAYTLYSNRQDDKAQLLLSQGIRSFAEYNASGNEEALKKAENAFNNTASEKRKKTQSIAKLYLGRIYYLKGKVEDAKKMYKEALSESSEPVIKTLSERALSYIEKK